MKTQVIKTELDKLQFIERLKHAEVVRPWEIKFGFWKDTRSNEQSRKMYAMLTDISKQVQWPVLQESGEYKNECLTMYEWKNLMTAYLDKHQKQTQGIEGGIVFMGRETSNMKAAELSDIIEILYMFGANHDVEWSE